MKRTYKIGIYTKEHAQSSWASSISTFKINSRMKRILILFISILVSRSSYAQFPVTDFGNLSMKILDYIEYLSTATSTAENLAASEKIFTQSKEYYNALKDVHSLVKKCHNVEGCIALSAETLHAYRSTYSKVVSDANFSSSQRAVYQKQQENILVALAKNIEGLNHIIINTGMSISDKERLDAIDTYHERILSLYNESRGLNLQMLGESESINKRKEKKRFERELLR